MKKLILIILCIFLMGCQEDTIKLGFTAGLSGILSDEAIATRNGFVLAAEEINAAGGINGSLIEITTKDDASTLEGLASVNQEFHDEGIHLIVGPFISSHEPEIRVGMKNFNHLYISPTITSSNLSNEDDQFYRVIGDTHMMASGIYDLIASTDVNSIVIIQDTDNSQMTQTIKEDLTKYIISGDVELLGVLELSKNTDLVALVDQIDFIRPDGLVFLTGSVHVSELIQLMQIKDLHLTKFVSTWALSTELIKNSGKESEGVLGLGFYDAYSQDEKLLSFKEKYYERFSTEPASTSILAYDAVYLFKAAIEKSGSADVESVKKALDELDEVEGFTGNYYLNEYGDAIRDYKKLKIIDGQIRGY
ncbi:ABC transporter substrate-binding protein [Acidaminobacter sp. JC074]|uniref:ABC transporter substrate-binding protein n=1 Tax=Acidaminobacter sp. JC074 TaxID=2530199 RepID=UPI001F0D4D16|nr:ABC transporter substrate-binding protein [Acidaminobacter sp. JC074]MCH4889091.1 ABC transporter substrate-binding protein [Acidaminobacter sp. JC074]